MENRNLDGVYFRIERDGKWENVCFSDLSELERIEIMKDKDANWLKSMCLILSSTIRKIGNELDLVAE